MKHTETAVTGQGPHGMAECPDPERAYARHHTTVRSALRLLGVEANHLDDAVQDVFAVFHRRSGDFERGRSLTNWLWGIARGVASGYRRSARRRARLQVALERVEHVSAEPIRRLEARAALEALLADLDADSCAIVILAEVEGRTGPEIAEKLGMNLNTVYARLRAARRSLRLSRRPSMLGRAIRRGARRTALLEENADSQTPPGAVRHPS